jgi:hypothetical protein
MKASNGRPTARAREFAVTPEPIPLAEVTGRELLAAFDEEVQNLFEAPRRWYCVTCGLTRDEAARQPVAPQAPCTAVSTKRGSSWASGWDGAALNCRRRCWRRVSQPRSSPPHSRQRRRRRRRMGRPCRHRWPRWCAARCGRWLPPRRGRPGRSCSPSRSPWSVPRRLRSVCRTHPTNRRLHPPRKNPPCRPRMRRRK